MLKQLTATLVILAFATTATFVLFNNNSEEQPTEPVKIFDEPVEIEDGGKVVGGYFPNWAQYRPKPYTYTPEHIAPIIPTLTHLYYGFVAFCPTPDMPQPYWVTQLKACEGKKPYDLTTLEPKDKQFIPTVVNYKRVNPKLKVIASLGGWNFPSAFYSEAVKTDATRQAFVKAIKAFVQLHQFDGIDFDWEYPCSAARTNQVKISCTKFDQVKDLGGNCPSKQYEHGVCTGECADKENFATMLTLLREQNPNMHISIAASASQYAVKNSYNVPKMDAALTHWNLMTYDYFVSDIDSATVTAPNQMLHPVKETGFPDDWSTATTIKAYKDAGATPSKMVLGLAYYGHTWYVPGVTDDSWQKFGQKAKIQGSCCGPFKQTYGAKFGKGSGQCGSMMYSEILAAGFETYYDTNAAAAIGYLKEKSGDAYTPAGTWISYLNTDSVDQFVKYGMSEGLVGAFSFDLSMDSIEWSSGKYNYAMTHKISDSVNKY